MAIIKPEVRYIIITIVYFGGLSFTTHLDISFTSRGLQGSMLVSYHMAQLVLSEGYGC